jgi:hypothetical protein
MQGAVTKPALPSRCPRSSKKSGAEGEYRRFKFEIIKLAEKNTLPGFALSIEQGKGQEPLLRMRRVAPTDTSEKRVSPGKRPRAEAPQVPTVDADAPAPALPREPKVSSAPASRPAQSSPPATVDARTLIRRTIAGLSDSATRGFMTDATIEHLRETCPGWDLHALHAEFETWVNAAPNAFPPTGSAPRRLGQAPPRKAPPHLARRLNRPEGCGKPRRPFPSIRRAHHLAAPLIPPHFICPAPRNRCTPAFRDHECRSEDRALPSSRIRKQIHRPSLQPAAIRHRPSAARPSQLWKTAPRPPAPSPMSESTARRTKRQNLFPRKHPAHTTVRQGSRSTPRQISTGSPTAATFHASRPSTGTTP